jgi:hypothetical protein
VEEGKEGGKMIREGWKKERKEEKYHTTSKILQSEFCYMLNIFGR